MEIHRDDQPHSSEFNLFVRSRICKLDTLREHMGHANFVAMDTEHGPGVGVSSIGLAFASDLRPVRYLTHPGVLTGYIWGRPWSIPVARSICFNIRGFERSRPTQEQAWSQPDEAINIPDVASKIIAAIRKFKEETKPEKPLILRKSRVEGYFNSNTPTSSPLFELRGYTTTCDGSLSLTPKLYKAPRSFNIASVCYESALLSRGLSTTSSSPCWQ